jgi:hypothetical protein
MRDMYLTEPASFDDILATLDDLERRINQTATNSHPDSRQPV